MTTDRDEFAKDAEIERLRALVDVRTQSWMNATDALVDRDAMLRIEIDEKKQLRAKLAIAEKVVELANDAVYATLLHNWRPLEEALAAYDATQKDGGE